MLTRKIARSSYATFLFALALSVTTGCGAMDEFANEEAQSIGEQKAAVVVTCPDPKSCGSWSGWTNSGPPVCQAQTPGCGTEICRPCHCNQDSCDTCCNTRPGPGAQQPQQNFRDCILKNHQACREILEQTIPLGCGC